MLLAKRKYALVKWKVTNRLNDDDDDDDELLLYYFTFFYNT